MASREMAKRILSSCNRCCATGLLYRARSVLQLAVFAQSLNYGCRALELSMCKYVLSVLLYSTVRS